MSEKNHISHCNKTGLQHVSRTCGTTPLGFGIAEEKNKTVLKTKQVKKLAAPSALSNLLTNLLPNLSPDLLTNFWEQKRSNLVGFLNVFEKF